MKKRKLLYSVLLEKPKYRATLIVHLFDLYGLHNTMYLNVKRTHL